MFSFSSYPVFGAKPNTFILAHALRPGKKRHPVAQGGRDAAIDNLAAQVLPSAASQFFENPGSRGVPILDRE